MHIIFLSITRMRLTSNLMNERPREAAEPTASRLHAADQCLGGVEMRRRERCTTDTCSEFCAGIVTVAVCFTVPLFALATPVREY